MTGYDFILIAAMLIVAVPGARIIGEYAQVEMLKIKKHKLFHEHETKKLGSQYDLEDKMLPIKAAYEAKTAELMYQRLAAMMEYEHKKWENELIALPAGGDPVEANPSAQKAAPTKEGPRSAVPPKPQRRSADELETEAKQKTLLLAMKAACEASGVDFESFTLAAQNAQQRRPDFDLVSFFERWAKANNINVILPDCVQ